MNWKEKLIYFKENITYWIGWILIPACLILCLLEFIWYMDENRTHFYFMNSLKWFIHLGEKNEYKKNKTHNRLKIQPTR